MAFIEAGSGRNSNTWQTAAAFTAIPAHLNGDLLVLCIGSMTATTPAVPVGAIWARLDAAVNEESPVVSFTKHVDAEAGSGSAVRSTIYTAIGDGLTDGVWVDLENYNIATATAQVHYVAQVLVFSKRSNTVETATPVTQESGVDIDSPDITPSVADSDIVRCFAFDDDVSTDADHDSDANFKGTSTYYAEATWPDNGMTAAVSYQAGHAASATGTSTWSTNADDDAGVAHTIALLPATDPIINSIGTAVDFTLDQIVDKETSLAVTGFNFEATQGTGKVEVSDNIVYATGTKVAQTVTAWGDTSISITADIGSHPPGVNCYMWVTNNSGDRNPWAKQVHFRRAHAFDMSPSTNIADAGEATTFQLTAPATKTTGDFDGGRIVDIENPDNTTVAVLDNEYREDEWCIVANAEAADANVYEFRVVSPTNSATTYTVNPRWTIASGVTHSGVATETLSLTAATIKEIVDHSAAGTGTLALTVAAPAVMIFGGAGAETLAITVAAPAVADHSAAGAETLTITTTSGGQPVDYQVPISDISTGTWENEVAGTTNLYLSIDEGEPGVTSDYMISTSLPDTVEVRLAAVGDPASSVYHVIQYSAERTDALSLDLTLSLVENTTVLDTWSDTVPQAETLFQRVLSGAVTDSITDYTNLRLRMTASVT